MAAVMRVVARKLNQSRGHKMTVLKLSAVVIAGLLSAPAAAQYRPCSQDSERWGFSCEALDQGGGGANHYVFVVDKSRDQAGRESSGPQGSLHVVDLQSAQVVQTWAVGLGCYRGRKRHQGDKRSPEGSYKLLQRRLTLDPESNRQRVLGGIFFLTSYPTLNECEAAGYTASDFGDCRRDLGDAVGLHSGRRMADCTNGCIRLTGDYDLGDDLIKELDRNYVQGGATSLVIGAQLHPSFYESNGQLSECWAHRLRALTATQNHDEAVDELAAYCEPDIIVSPDADSPAERDGSGYGGWARVEKEDEGWAMPSSPGVLASLDWDWDWTWDWVWPWQSDWSLDGDWTWDWVWPWQWDWSLDGDWTSGWVWPWQWDWASNSENAWDGLRGSLNSALEWPLRPEEDGWGVGTCIGLGIVGLLVLALFSGSRPA